jgi:hypothetical protein
VRVVGPMGIERLMFLSPEACERVLVNEWREYPRVSDSWFEIEYCFLGCVSRC